MKQVKHWITNTLPEKIANMTLENIRESRLTDFKNNFTSALMSFKWAESKQGFEFWREINEHYGHVGVFR